MNKKHKQRLHPSGLNSRFASSTLSFPDYIRHIQSIIARARVDLSPEQCNPERADTIIAANSPFEIKPPVGATRHKNGVLLIHGLFDSPFSMRDMADYFANKGFLVRSILLPGHGTVPGDLLNIKYQDWVKASTYGLASLRDEVENIYIAGVSTGAALAIYHALKETNLAGIVLFTPAIKIKSPFAQFTNWHHALSWAIPRCRWFKVGKDTDYSRYQTYALNAAWQVLQLLKEIRRMQQSLCLTIPQFVVMSDDDEVVCPQATLDYFELQTHPHTRLIRYSKDKAAHDQYSELDNVIMRNSHFPEQRVLDFSHIAIPFSPRNPHYGREGDFKDFQHYEHSLARWFKPKHNGEPYAGALSPMNLKQYYLQRLTYNPDYHAMVSSLDQFIDTTTTDFT